jgi:hypothetical protein
VSCSGQDGVTKAQDLAKQLSDQVNESQVFRNSATFTAVELVLNKDGRLEGRIPEDKAFVFTAINSTPCKERADQEVDKINTTALKVGVLQLIGTPSTGFLTLLIDEVQQTIPTAGKPAAVLLDQLTGPLRDSGRNAVVVGTTLTVVDARSIQAITTDETLSVAFGLVERCDVDGDGDVDLDDLQAIFAARGAPAAPGDPRDVDGDGVITVNDVRICTPRKCPTLFFITGTAQIVTPAPGNRTPCTPNPCTGACFPAAHANADARAKTTCNSFKKSSGARCELGDVTRNPNQERETCVPIPNASFTCVCTVADTYDCDP